MNFKGKNITVMGLGRFDGGVAVARFLLKQGARITVTDLAPAEKLTDSIKSVGHRNVTYHLGGHVERDFIDADLLVVNPAVKPSSEWLALARKHRVPITTEMNIFFELCPARKIIGVTGSVGKTTTASMIYHALRGPGVWLGGNIGRSLLPDLGKIARGDTIVLELSSAQLERLAPTGHAPHIAVVTNITQNHLDWHSSMRSYAGAKKNIVLNQSSRDVAVLSWDDRRVRSWQDCGDARKMFFSIRHTPPQGMFLRDGMIIMRTSRSLTALLDTRKMQLPGLHNVANAAAALAACAAAGADLPQAARRLASFKGAEHRLELVRELRGVRYYNDSKATTPDSAIAALSAFDSPAVLILGGRDKGMDYEKLIRAASHCRAVVLLGEMAGPLDKLFSRHAPATTRRIAKSFAYSVKLAASLAQNGDVVLLSPACTSYDMFNNFEERGHAFKQAVAELK